MKNFLTKAKNRLTSNSAADGTAEKIVIVAMVIVLVVIVMTALGSTVREKGKKVNERIEKADTDFETTLK